MLGSRHRYLLQLAQAQIEARNTQTPLVYWPEDVNDVGAFVRALPTLPDHNPKGWTSTLTFTFRGGEAPTPVTAILRTGYGYSIDYISDGFDITEYEKNR